MELNTSPTPPPPPAPGAPTPARRRWVRLAALAAAVVLLVAAVVGFVQYRAAGERALADAVERHRAGDCEAAMDGYDWVTSRFGLTFSEIVPTATANREECEALLVAEAVADGDFEATINAYRDHQREYPDSLLTEALRSRTLDTYHAWAESLRTRGFHDEAIEVYEQVRRDFPDEPVDDEISATVVELAEARAEEAESRGRAGAFVDALDGYVALAREYPDTPAGQRARQAVTDPDEAIRALGASEPCSARRIMRWFAEAGEPVPPPVSAEARGALPRLHYDCGASRYEEGRYRDALGLLDEAAAAGGPLAEQARALARQAEAGYVQETVAAFAETAFDLPTPERVGGAPGGTVVLEIFNGDAEEELEVLLSGPTPTRTVVPPCPGCVCEAPLFGQGVTVEVEPGSYQFAMGRPEDFEPDPDPTTLLPVFPRGYGGTWEFAGGSRYWTGLC